MRPESQLEKKKGHRFDSYDAIYPFIHSHEWISSSFTRSVVDIDSHYGCRWVKPPPCDSRSSARDAGKHGARMENIKR